MARQHARQRYPQCLLVKHWRPVTVGPIGNHLPQHAIADAEARHFGPDCDHLAHCVRRRHEGQRHHRQLAIDQQQVLEVERHSAHRDQ